MSDLAISFSRCCLFDYNYIKTFLLNFEAQNVNITAMSKKKCLKLGWPVRRRMFLSWEEMHQEKKTMAPHQRAHLRANDAVE